jgi:hypothetical protein
MAQDILSRKLLRTCLEEKFCTIFVKILDVRGLTKIHITSISAKMDSNLLFNLGD